jgi:hypothetical protein
MAISSRSCPSRNLSPVAVGILLTALIGLSGRADAGDRGQGKAKSAAPASDGGPAAGKVAVFNFDGDDATKVRKHVVMALTNQGLQVDTSLKPAQTAEEFRDMGAMLDLAAYVHGRIKDLPADKAEVTITVRSGVTGRTIASATIVGYRGGLRFDVEEKLWERVGRAITQACREAKKPRRPVNAPTHIEAGSPL